MDSPEVYNIIEGDFSFPLPIPATIDGLQPISLTAAINTSQLLANKYSSVWGYNGNVLGPTIMALSGNNIEINFQNDLPEETNIHWHGLLVPQSMDGHPENIIHSGSSFNFNFTLNQRAGTYWYHPHPHTKTAHQVYKGLAGFFFVRDTEESALNLPSGELEIPLVIQDKRIYSDGGLNYSPGEMDIMTGYFGQYVLVNGKCSPFHNVSTKWHRLRLLNGSTARIYNLALSNGSSFMLIGNDGGLLSSSVSVNSILLAQGERADVLVDFTSETVGTEIFLINQTFSDTGMVQGNQSFNIMKFKVVQIVTDTFSPPGFLSSIVPISVSQSIYNRNFDINQMDMADHSGMNMNGMAHTINGKSYDMSRIDETVAAGTTEIWTFDNSRSDEIHPIHIHGVQFQVLERTGGRGQLLLSEQGWKDTVLVMANEKVRVIMTFPVNPGKFVLHCHNLEHEDSGMMLNFEIL